MAANGYFQVVAEDGRYFAGDGYEIFRCHFISGL